MAKLEMPFFKVEAPAPVMLAGFAFVVVGSVLKQYVRGRAYNEYLQHRASAG